MVPVKKPGRPLSACPHLHNQLCGCSSVTAAIPRKRKCHCAQPPPASAIPDITSSTKIASPSSSRPSSMKPSYDLSNLERMDPSNVDIIPYQILASQTSFGQAVRNGQFSSMTYIQYANDLQDPQYSAGIQGPLLQSHYPDLRGQQYHTNGAFPASGGAIITANDSYLQLDTVGVIPVAGIAPSGGSSCCGTEPEIRNKHIPYIAQECVRGDSSMNAPVLSGVSSISSGGTPETPKSTRHLGTKQHLFPIECSIRNHQTTTYVYPASYGSYQHPLQPWEWCSMSNMSTQPLPQPQMSDELTSFTSDTLPIPETLHTCGCGDTCQCIGCAAHPYNAATQKYVRSAYNMAHEPSTSTTTGYINGHNDCAAPPPTADPSGPHTSGNSCRYSNGEENSPPGAETPSDSSTAEEQTLSASDYFFVNYPFSSEGCGGNTNSCPCGDDCECVDCIIHRFDESTTAPPSDP